MFEFTDPASWGESGICISVEKCCLAVGEVVGHESILSASKMNNAIVIFLSTVEKANELVEAGIVC